MAALCGNDSSYFSYEFVTFLALHCMKCFTIAFFYRHWVNKNSYVVLFEACVAYVVDVLQYVKYFFVYPQEFSAVWNCSCVCVDVLILVIILWLLLCVLWRYVVITYNWICSTCLILNLLKTMVITGWISYPVKESAVV
jgi:hypothetical protein